MTLSFLKLVRNWPKNAVLNLALYCGVIWRHREKPQYRCTTTLHPVYNCSKKIFGKFTSCRTFGAHKLVHSKPFLEHLYELWHLLSTLGCDVRNFFLYRCTSTVSTLNNCSRTFSKPSAIYTKWCAQSFQPIFGFSAIFDRDFAKIAAQPSDGYANWVVLLKEQSLLKKTQETASKSTYKPSHNTWFNYVPHAQADQAWQTKNSNFRSYSRRA